MSLLLKMSKSPTASSSSLKYLRHVIAPHPPRHHPAFPKKSPKISLSTTQPNKPNSIFNFNFNPNPESNPRKPPPFQWHGCNNAENGGLNISKTDSNNNNSNSNNSSNNNSNNRVTVVVLGWLGAGPRQLRRYVEMYKEKGYNAVTFVVSVREALVLGLGRGLEERVAELAGSLAGWAEEEEEERVFVFHTFSNTGWLAYGAILDNWRGRHDLLMKIKGCIVDSGAESELDPKVWAAGFVAAVLKKRSSLNSSASSEIGKQTNSEAGFSKTTDEEPLFTESVLMAVFEKLFSFLFSLPDVSGRLRYVLSTLMNDQPLCPQLYLYSTADKVIPFKSVEAFMEKQRKIGREVWSFNFGLSPHVDHYRTFPEIYSAQLLNFLQECLVTVKLY